MHCPQPPPDKLKILVVSLSNIWTRSVQAILASLEGFDLLDIAGGGLTAYEVALAEQPQLMVVDDSLPLDEVLRLLELLSQAPAHPYAIVVVPSIRHKWFMLRAGADATVLNTDTLADLLSAVLVAREQIFSNQ